MAPSGVPRTAIDDGVDGSTPVGVRYAACRAQSAKATNSASSSSTHQRNGWPRWARKRIRTRLAAASLAPKRH